MKRLSLSLSVVILALSSAVSASDFEEDKQYISCRKGAVNDRQLTACQEGYSSVLICPLQRHLIEI